MSKPTLLSGLLEPLGECLDAESARRLVALRADEAIADRVAELADRANEGELTVEEQREYEAVVNAMDFISILKLKARQRIHAAASA